METIEIHSIALILISLAVIITNVTLLRMMKHRTRKIQMTLPHKVDKEK